MYSTPDDSAIAIRQVYCDRQVVKTPQRRANYKNKDRFKLKDLKRIAFKNYGCTSSAEVKKYLKLLKVSLDLRLTAAWDAVVYELRPKILALKEMLNTSSQPQPQFKAGDYVFWKNAPAYLHTYWDALKVMSITEGKASLEMWVGSPIPLSELRAA